jgi:hypothetical protein
MVLVLFKSLDYSDISLNAINRGNLIEVLNQSLIIITIVITSHAILNAF